MTNSNKSQTIPTLNKELSKRDFLKMIGGFLAFFSFGGFASLLSNKLNTTEVNTNSNSYGSRPFGM